MYHPRTAAHSPDWRPHTPFPTARILSLLRRVEVSVSGSMPDA